MKRKLLLSYLFEIYFDVLQRLNYSTWATFYYALLAILFFLLRSHMIINKFINIYVNVKFYFI